MKIVFLVEGKINFKMVIKNLLQSVTVLLLFYFFPVNHVHAQKTVSIIDSKDGFTNVQGQTLGDSIFLTYYNAFSKNSQNFCSMLVAPEGKQLPLLLPELHKRTLVAATQTPDSLCIYYVDKNDDNALTTLMLHKRNFGRVIRPMNVPLDGQIKTVFVDKNLFLVTINKTKGIISFVELKNGLPINRQDFSVPEDTDNLIKLNTAVIQHADHVWPAEAITPVKIYVRDGLYYVTLEYAIDKQSTYVVLNLDKSTGMVSRWKLQSNAGREDFASFITDDKLIRVTKDNNYAVSIYNIQTQHAIDSFLITKKSPVAKEAAIYRDDRNIFVSHNFPIKKIIKKPGSAFVVGYTTDSTVVLKLGTHNVSAPFFPMISGLGLALQAITAAVSVAIRLNATENLDQYFYVTWDGHSYTYLKNPVLAESAMDKFELAPSISFKGYLAGSTISYGIYKFSYDKLWLVAFKR